MKNKHTPGPWLKGNPDKDNNTEIFGDDFLSDGTKANGMINVCTVWGDNAGSLHDEVNTANASLIAAAPELLEALEMFVKKFAQSHSAPSNYPHYRDAINAIKKAKGE